MKVLITGGAGFIGKWIVEKFPPDTEIVVVDSLEPQVHAEPQDFCSELKTRAVCVRADIRNTESYRDFADGSDVVIHLASQTGTGQSMYEMSRYVQHNVDGTAHLLELISSLKHKPHRFILSSSRAVYGDGVFSDGTKIYLGEGRRVDDLERGIWDVCNEAGLPLTSLPMQESHPTNPTSIYGLTKLWQEQLVQNYCTNNGIDPVIFRFQNVYGPKQELSNPYTGIIGIFTNSITQQNKVELFEDGLMTRDFVFVEDVARAVVQSSSHNSPISSIINIGSGQPTTLLQLVNTIAQLTDKQPAIKISGRFRIGDIRHAIADMSHYHKIFGGWHPTSLEHGLTQYLHWYLDQTPPSLEDLRSSLVEMEKKGLLKTAN